MRSKYEALAEKELRAGGWAVDTKVGMGRWSKNRDYFHIFDLVAVKRGFPVRWISIKGLMGVPSSHGKAVEDFWLPEGNVKEIWSRSQSKRGGWNKQIIK